MMSGLSQDQNLEKQIGCMSGFLHIFDRQQILSGKRIYSPTKRLPPPSSPESVKSVKSVQSVKLVNEIDIVIEKPHPTEPVSTRVLENPVANSTPPKSWKFCKEMPRLSLDSRATVDSKGSLCKKEIGEPVRSPSVIARLMGLEQLPSDCSSPESVEKPELRRSASESRVSRDLFHSRFMETNQTAQINQTETNLNISNINTRNAQIKNHKNETGKTSQWRSRSFFDSVDFFPEPKPTRLPVYDSGKKMKLRGIDDQTKDLEALKHILEALQLKGLLHSKKPLNRNIVYDRNFLSDDSNVVLTKPSRSPVGVNRRFGNGSPVVSPRSGRSPVRARVDSNLKNCNSIAKRKPLSVETQRSFIERNSPISSPKLNTVANRSPIRRKPTENVYSNHKVNKNFLTEDETSSSSVSFGSTTSHSDQENRDGKSLLQRCDKLLQNIAEFNSLTESQPSLNSVLPSPVSVLDSVFDKDDSSFPSPVMKRTIDFKDLTVDLEDEIWSSIISPARSTNTDNDFISNDSDFTYISEILEASKYLSDESTVFSFLEKQQYFSSKGSKLHRKLVFDVITEILIRNRELPPWNPVWVTDSGNSVKKICLEFQKIREPEKSENLSDPISPALKKDLTGNNCWGEYPLETSEAILYIERLIFKDLVSETIRDLAEFPAKTTFFAPRRKLVF